MAIGSLVLLMAGAILATYDTNTENHPVVNQPTPYRPPGTPNNIPVLGLDPEETPEYGRDQSVTANGASFKRETPLRPSEKLGLYEWMALMRELGYYEDGDEPVAAFWNRLEQWNQEQERLLAEVALAPSGLLAPGLGTPTTGGSADLVQADT